MLLENSLARASAMPANEHRLANKDRSAALKLRTVRDPTYRLPKCWSSCSIGITIKLCTPSERMAASPSLARLNLVSDG
ncbi:Uncharacterised protein [Mycobacteroides abscessus]|nr:Uncharacterised protein [Mycobacteroides abscessus]